MTPENIHLNSFMYEPILDMSSDELINLYQEIKSLWSKKIKYIFLQNKFVVFQCKEKLNTLENGKWKKKNWR